MNIRIDNGEVIDPCAGENGVCRSVHVRDGKISASAGASPFVIDASGCVVMAGGVDIHTHVAGPLASLTQIPRPAAPAAFESLSVPPAAAIGHEYVKMGYTILIDPAIHFSSAFGAHVAAAKVPIADKGLLTMMDAAPETLKIVESKDRERIAALVAWLVRSSLGYSVKLVNPGGEFLADGTHDLHDLDDNLNGFNLTPRGIITSVADAVERLGLPHPLHLHPNNIGLPGCHKTVIDTIRALDGRQAHIAHLQYYSYGTGGANGFSSEAPQVAEAINASPGVTADAGQIVFGPASTFTADRRLAERLRELTSHRDMDADERTIEKYYTTPYSYSPESFVNSAQWAAGLELLLLIDDPWKIFLTTDYPNGGPFSAYPYIIKMLMDSAFRAEALSLIQPRARDAAPLKAIGREYSLYEIAVITRAGPAKRLGLDNKGSLVPGADADIAIYSKGDDYERMFAYPAWVIKDGKIVAKDGEIVAEKNGRTLYLSGLEDAAGQAPWEIAPLTPDELPQQTLRPAKRRAVS